jgi:hypothetical protein
MTAPYRILVTGSRDWDDPKVIYRALGEARGDTPHDRVVLVHGGARGADAMAARYAEAMDWGVEACEADWQRHGKAAGFIRNAEMVSLGADVCLAFIRNSSRGATHCADAAEKAGIPVRRYLA